MKLKKPKVMQLLLTICTICIGLFLVGWVTPVLAANGMRVGKFDVNPAITVKGEYNDNIFSSDQNEDDDYIITITPAIALKYKSGGGLLNMGYAVDIASYADFSENNFRRHKPYANLKLNPPSGLYLKIDESFIYTEDPYGSENEYGLGLSTRRLNNTMGIATGFKFAKKYGVEASYQGYIQRYEQNTDDWQDVNDNTFGISMFYQATAKTNLFWQYQYREVEYPEQNDGAVVLSGAAWSSATSQDNSQNLFFLGARFSPFGKITGEVKLGFGKIEHDNDMDLNGARYEDENTWVAQTRIGYKMRERTRFSLMLNRSYKVTSNEADQAPGYFDTLIRIGVEQKMRNRLKANLDLDWNTQDYQNQGTEKYFDIYRIKAGLTYEINQWLNAGVLYRFKNKTATEKQFEGSEYTVNSIAFLVSAKY